MGIRVASGTREGWGSSTTIELQPPSLPCPPRSSGSPTGRHLPLPGRHFAFGQRGGEGRAGRRRQQRVGRPTSSSCPASASCPASSSSSRPTSSSSCFSPQPLITLNYPLITPSSPHYPLITPYYPSLLPNDPLITLNYPHYLSLPPNYPLITLNYSSLPPITPSYPLITNYYPSLPFIISLPPHYA